MNRYSDLLSFAEVAARGAGAITLEYFNRGVAVEYKSDASPVTVADRKAEDFLRAEIEKRFPDHGILGEERGSTRPGAPLQWILDPIDGTESFIRGVPFYGVLIALQENGESRLGAIYHPALDLLVSAETGGVTRANGEIARVAEAPAGAAPLILVTNHADLYQRRPGFAQALMARYGKQRSWGDCYGYTMVALGRAQAMIDPIVNVWDAAPLKPIIEGAGGVFTDLEGAATSAGDHALAATPRLHAEILELLREYPAGNR